MAHPLQARLAAGCAALPEAVPESVQARLLEYLDLLVRWNRAYNLTAVRDPGEMVTRHLLDSLSVLPWLVGRRFIDVGTGAGLPGIPLALCRPDAAMVLLDSNGKKTRFLFQVVQALGLTQVEVVCARVEAYRPPERFDAVLSRAFASLEEGFDLTRHLLAPDGVCLAMKGALEDPAELSALAARGIHIACHPLQVPGLDAQRTLVTLRDGPAAGTAAAQGA